MHDRDEIRILLRDPHEIGEIDGAWGAGVARLLEENGVEKRKVPLVLTEPAIEPCIAAAAPGISIVVSKAGGAPPGFAREAPACAAFLDLLYLRGRLPDGAHWTRIRSYGLRSAILGCALAHELDRPHTAMLVDPYDLSVPVHARRWRMRAWIRQLERKVLACADEIETLDDECAAALAQIAHPADRDRIRVRPVAPRSRRQDVGSSTERGGRTCAGEGGRERPGVASATPSRLAIEASTRNPRSNRIALDAIRGLGMDGLRLEWLAPRVGVASMRARQDIRRWGVAGALHWDDSPWTSRASPVPERWDLLLRPDPRPGARPLQAAARAEGTVVMIPHAPGRNGGGNRGDGLLDVEWDPRHLRAAMGKVLFPRAQMTQREDTTVNQGERR